MIFILRKRLDRESCLTFLFLPCSRTEIDRIIRWKERLFDSYFRMTERPRTDKSQSKSNVDGPKADEEDDETFLRTPNADDDQARIRRRAPTRHSIKSLSGRKTLSKQPSNPEVK